MSEVWRWKPPKYTCPNCGKAPQSHLGTGPSPIDCSKDITIGCPTQTLDNKLLECKQLQAFLMFPLQCKQLYTPMQTGEGSWCGNDQPARTIHHCLIPKWICDISMMLIYGNSTTSKIRHGTYCTQFWCAKLRFMRQCVYSPVCI